MDIAIRGFKENFNADINYFLDVLKIIGLELSFISYESHLLTFFKHNLEPEKISGGLRLHTILNRQNPRGGRC